MLRAFATVALASAATASVTATPARWTEDDVWQLAQSIVEAGRQGLRPEDYDLAELGFADQDAVADAAAKVLAHDLNEGRASSDRADWHIDRPALDYDRWLADALARHDLRAAFRALNPASAGYAQLATAWLQCTDVTQCDTLALNLDRWRRLPRNLGPRYLWVNVPAFRVDLVEAGRIVASHRVIVGKPGSPTPVFKAAVTGVTANPWWNVPCAIVRESIGHLLRARPAEAHRRGFVTKGKGTGLVVRQRPGPGNALGQIKLEMPNPYNVYLHDTPDRGLFEKPVRAFSHGCIRTDRPLALAMRFLGPTEVETLENAIATGTSRTIAVKPPLPVYVVYFTAEADPAGGITYHDDIYGRDRDDTDRGTVGASASR